MKRSRKADKSGSMMLLLLAFGFFNAEKNYLVAVPAGRAL